MPKFKKAMLEADRTYHSPDGPLPVTRERIRHWAKKFSEFAQSNIKVPISWNHGEKLEDLVPVKFSSDRKTRLPQGTVGYLDAFEVSADGRRAELTLDIRRNEDAEKVRHNLAYVSPVIFESWRDGDGTSHRDVITHVDLVQHPVDHHQSEFEPVSVACALRMSTTKGKPVMYRLQDEPMEDESPADDMPEETTDAPVADENGRMKNVKEALAKLNIVLSDDTNEENFLEHLEQALLTVAAMSGDDMGNGGLEDAAVATPEVAALSLETKRWREHANNEHRSKVAQRLSALVDSGRCTPAEAKAKQSTVASVRLSLDDSGKHRPTTLEAWIESREAVPAGTFFPAGSKLRLGVAEHPAVVEGEELTPDKIDKLVSEVFRR